ncbi:MAG: hypothetical protein ACJA2V_001054, partial [Alcanivorax sp.]
TGVTVSQRPFLIGHGGLRIGEGAYFKGEGAIFPAKPAELPLAARCLR